MKSIVQNLILDALNQAKKSGKLCLTGFPEIVIEEPRDSKLGDFSTNVAMTLAKSERKKPLIIGKIICEYLKNGEDHIAAAETVSPGFINLKMSSSFYLNCLIEVAEKGNYFGRSKIGDKQKVNLEYVSANPTGPLHVGHGRGAAVGDTLGNLLTWAGFDVIKEYYVNDVGNQIKTLGKSTWLRYRELFGESIDFPEDHYRGEYVSNIAREIKCLYKDRFVNKTESEFLPFFMKFASNQVLDGIKKDLSDFRVSHDIWFNEKSLYEDGQVEHAIAWLRDNDFIYEKDGAVWLKSSAFNDEKDRVIVKNTGEKTYFCSDIAYHKNKIDRGFTKIIDIWGSDHHGYVPRMRSVLEAMEWDKSKFCVILVQFVTLKRGDEKIQMSTRSGDFVTLADVISEVGVDAARFFFLMRSADSHLDFDLELAKKETPENPVYYIQYAHARICNIFLTAQEKGIDCENLDKANLDYLGEEDFNLIKKMMQFPEIIEKSALSLEVHRLPFYLLDLASIFHGFYKRNRIVTNEIEATRSRLLLIHCLLMIFKNGLTLMGLSAPEKM